MSIFPCIRSECPGICVAFHTEYHGGFEGKYRWTCDTCEATYNILYYTTWGNMKIIFGFNCISDGGTTIYSDPHLRLERLPNYQCKYCKGNLYISNHKDLDLFNRYIVTRRHPNERGRRIIDSDNYRGHKLYVDRDGTYAAKIKEREANIHNVKANEINIDYHRYNLRMAKRHQPEVSYDEFLKIRMKKEVEKDLANYVRHTTLVRMF